jgi:hypothetical protein
MSPQRVHITDNPITAIKQKPIQQRCIRYQNSTTDPVAVTRGDLLNWIVATSTSFNTKAIALVEAVRLVRVRIVGYAESGADPSFLSLEWNGDRSPSVLTTVAVAEALAGVISEGPPDSSLASVWSIRGSDQTEVLFTIDVSAHTAIDLFMDLHIEYVLGDGSLEEFTLAVASTTTGVAYLTLPNDDDKGFIPVGLTAKSIV